MRRSVGEAAVAQRNARHIELLQPRDPPDHLRELLQLWDPGKLTRAVSGEGHNETLGHRVCSIGRGENVLIMKDG